VHGGFFRQDESVLDVADYELAWPADLFAAEAGRLLARPQLSHQSIDLL